MGGDSGLTMGGASSAIVIFGSLRVLVSALCTFAALSPGIMRHWMVALARCGKAFSAWPPVIKVATHVVRNSALKRTTWLSRSAAADRVDYAQPRAYRRSTRRAPDPRGKQSSRE